MKRLVSVVLLAAGFASTANADGIPKSYSPPTTSAPFSWTGFYVGAHVGYGWGGDNTTFFSPNDQYATALLNGKISVGGQAVSPITTDSAGVFGGIQAGYNWQMNRNWIAGIETDFSWSDINGDGSTNPLLAPPSLTGTFTINEDVEWFGTLRGRIGWLPSERWLIYATGGLAYGGLRDSFGVTTAGSFNAVLVGLGGFGMDYTNPGRCFAASSSGTEAGWTIGGGTEIALTRNISLKVEYLYVNLGGGDTFVATTLHPFTAPTSISVHTDDVEFHTVRTGINYKF
jgi:outer membrane immunogenic protein